MIKFFQEGRILVLFMGNVMCQVSKVSQCLAVIQLLGVQNQPPQNKNKQFSKF